ncbi:MAG: hypothetical protein KGL69_10255 [Alphaproteobacteria bacterium]|nr:hypothetical protein [Alphaproteobacteria bacterium]
MTLTKTAIAGALSAFTALAAAGVALASPAHLTDGQYIEAERCQALMSSSTLGKVDATAIDKVVRAEGAGRIDEAYQMGQQAHRDAAREASTAGPYARSQLIAERDGVCRTLAGEQALASGSAAGGRGD